jgi:thiosulfate reductase cytochrome b subunit
MLGKLLIIIGIILILTGLIITYHGKMPFLGKLPGDISIERNNFKFYSPITTCIIFSIVISLLLLIINRLRN